MSLSTSIKKCMSNVIILNATLASFYKQMSVIYHVFFSNVFASLNRVLFPKTVGHKCVWQLICTIHGESFTCHILCDR